MNVKHASRVNTQSKLLMIGLDVSLQKHASDTGPQTVVEVVVVVDEVVVDVVVLVVVVVVVLLVVVEVVVVVALGFFSDGTHSSRRWMSSGWAGPNWLFVKVCTVPKAEFFVL